VKYPIDPQTTETFLGHLTTHDRAQRKLIAALTGLLIEAMNESGMEDTDWYPEAKKLLKQQAAVKTEHENRLFNAKNGHQERHDVKVEISATPDLNTPIIEAVALPGNIIVSPEVNHELTKIEAGFGEEISEAELERMFNEKSKKKTLSGEVDLSKQQPFKGMTLQEIEEWERKQENSNDIYKIKGRVQNLAVGISGGNLTPVGEIMVNSFVHVLKDLYEFAERDLINREDKVKMIERIRKHESMPGTLIAAAAGGVRVPKNENSKRKTNQD